MADTPHKPITHAAYDARFVQTSWHTVGRSRKLLNQAKLLVTATEGGSVIGVRVPDLVECDPAEGVK